MINCEKRAKLSMIGSVMRKALGDVTNIENPNYLLEECGNDPAVALQRVLKENETLRKSIEEKNKLIQLSGKELGSLRMTVQKLQLQNRSLAQCHSQMLMELNSGKDKLKVLQHELMCKEAVFNAKCSEETKQKAGGQECVNIVVEQLPNICFKIEESNKKTSRSKSLGPCKVERQTETKRHCLRRSEKFKSNGEQEPKEELFEIDVNLHQTKPVKDSSSYPNSDSVVPEVQVEESDSMQQRLPRRSSTGRPLRRAAEKVESYKERSVNTKLRRL